MASSELELEDFISLWSLMRILMVGGLIYEWSVNAKDVWIVKGIITNSRFDEDVEEIINRWWGERRGNCVIKGAELSSLLKKLNNDDFSSPLIG